MNETIEDRTLALIAQGILDASDEEILETARARGVDVAALQAHVRRLVDVRDGKNAALEHGAGQGPFSVGQAVALRSDPSRVGIVTTVVQTNRETRYSVFIGSRLETLYESQLVVAAPAAASPVLTADEYKARLTALQLTAPSLTNLHSLQAGRIDFIPYQYRPVLKFIRSDRPRLLLADEVGVGKTIEAGLLLRELQARRPLRNVLIVCSKTLVIEEKWQREMRRFDEEFTPLDGKTLRYCLDQTDLDGEWPDRYGRAIVPYSLFNEGMLLGATAPGRRLVKGLLDLDAPPRFDLLIVDEAHNARNQETQLHQGLRVLADNAEAVVLITATPVQLGTDDLFSMLNLLRPDLVIDKPTFERMAAPNRAINEAIGAVRQGGEGWQERALAALAEAAGTDWGGAMLGPSPEFGAVLAQVRAAADDESRVRLIHRVEGLHSFSLLINRTRRRDIGAFTVRKPKTEPVPFTSFQKEVHDALLAAQARLYKLRHGSGPLGFLMTTIRRQAASSIHAMVPFLEQVFARGLSAVENAEIGGEAEDVAAPDLAGIKAEIDAVLTLARSLPADDPKLERLLGIVADKAAMPNRRLLLFSTFRHTLAYLERALQANGVRVGLIHGDVADEERRRLRAAFAAPPDYLDAIDVLLTSEVGSEGLDFQFCDALVNYDMPWNPMRIEQRIGRIDRYGQASETVAIYNLVTPDTVDFDIYDRCLLRIGIFERAVGGSEAILGEIGKALQSVAEDLVLTPEERQRRLQQIADNQIRQVAETEALEERQAELFGIRMAKARMVDDIEAASSLWLEPAGIERLVSRYLELTLGLGRSPVSGSGLAKTLRLSVEARRRLLPPRRSGRLSPVEREWESFLKGDQPNLGLTFDREAALADPALAFVTPVHPLARAAARELGGEDDVQVALLVSGSGHALGRHPFAIYQWQLTGLKEDALLVPVVTDETIGRDLMRLMAEAYDAGEVEMPSASEFDALDGWHHETWQARRERHQLETAEIARFRRDSLETSHRARLATLQEQLARAGDGRIRRMRSAQVARAEAENAQALTELAKAEQRADILFRRVATGVLVVEG